MKKKPPHTIQKKDANADPQISKDELPDSELNKVTGGRESSTPSVSEITVLKKVRQIFALIGLRRTLATAFRAWPQSARPSGATAATTCQMGGGLFFL